MQDYVMELRKAIAEATPKLLALTDDESARRPAPDRWSPREIVGHLIDSASNNHQRFIRAQFQDELAFQGYEQEAWVRVQRYQDAPWKELVTLWQTYNLHIARVMEAAPEQERTRERGRHNLNQIGWQTVPEDKPATLDYLMSDYVGHLKNHLRQILG
jgi:DinB superfamily